MPKINIFCKASIVEGLGHLIRQVHIGRVLRKQNADIIFYIPRFPTAEEILKKHNFPYSTVDDFDSTPSTKRDKTDITILDIQETPSSLIQTLRKQTGKRSICRIIPVIRIYNSSRNNCSKCIFNRYI